MLALCLVGVLAISPESRPCVRSPLPLRPPSLACLPLPLLLLVVSLLRSLPLLRLPLGPSCPLRPRLLAWPAPLVSVVPLALSPPPPLRPLRASGPRRRLGRRRRSSPRRVVLADLRVPVARRVRLERLRPDCGLSLLWRCSVFFFFFFFLLSLLYLRLACGCLAGCWWLVGGCSAVCLRGLRVTPMMLLTH